MVTVAVWCDVCGEYHYHSFTPMVLPSVDNMDEFDDEVYWLPAWGFNPYIESDGKFNAEWN